MVVVVVPDCNCKAIHLIGLIGLSLVIWTV